MELAHFKIKQGRALSSNGSPVQDIPNKPLSVSRAAILGADYLGFRPRFEVSKGDRVFVGQVICRDRKYPEITLVAPTNGRVASIDYGPRRTLSAIVIENEACGEELSEESSVDYSSDKVVREALLERGMWPAFRTRPFGRTPIPSARPAAIFVNATRSSILAPDPWRVLRKQSDDFHLGVELLTGLTKGMVYVCQAPEESLCPVSQRVKIAHFSGSSAAGWAGTHINRLHRVSLSDQVWSIGYQDVAAIGHLFRTGRYSSCRIVSIAGKIAAQPRLIETCLGASIKEISQNEATSKTKQAVQVISGDPITGRDAAFLGRFHDQITMLVKATDSLLLKRFLNGSSTQAGIIPTGNLENAIAIDVLPVPLMRALSIGDKETAKSLGCLELLEEDVALLSKVCTSGSNYGVLLRQVLDELMEDAA